jgi:membrane protease YdiL (CAAX protease family)
VTETKRPKGYLEQTRDFTNSVILIAPLLVAYEAGLLLSGEGWNGVDFVTGAVLHLGGLKALLIMNVVILILTAIAAGRREEARSFSPSLLPGLLVESLFYAVIMGFLINLVMRHIPGLGGATANLSLLGKLTASAGAGVNEEVFFRLLLLGGLAWVLGNKGKGKGKKEKEEGRGTLAYAVAAVVSSLAFSAVHHLGPLGDPFSLDVFVYRFFAGMVLAMLFLTRGLAVAVYTHALYDIYVLT